MHELIAPLFLLSLQLRYLDCRNGLFGCIFLCRMPIVGAVLFVILCTVLLFSVLAFFVWLQMRDLFDQLPAYTAQFEVVVEDSAATLRSYGLNYSSSDLHEKIQEFDLQSVLLAFLSENFAALAQPIGTSVLFLIFLLPARADNTLRTWYHEKCCWTVSCADNLLTSSSSSSPPLHFLHLLPPADILHATFGDSQSEGYVHARASLRNVKHSVETYFKNKVFVAAINGVPAAIILTLWGAPVPLVFGLITFCMDFIPSIGSAIATFLPIPTLLLSPAGNGVVRAIGGFASLTGPSSV